MTLGALVDVLPLGAVSGTVTILTSLMAAAQGVAAHRQTKQLMRPCHGNCEISEIMADVVAVLH